MRFSPSHILEKEARKRWGPSNLVAEIKQRADMHAVAGMVGIELPERTGKPFANPFRPDQNPSCGLYQSGGEVRFRDWTTGQNLDCIGFYAEARGIINRDAIRELAGRLGILTIGQWAGAASKPSQPPKLFYQSLIADPVREIPTAVLSIWQEGVGYLVEDELRQKQIADWRGWSLCVVKILVEGEWIGAPLYQGRREIAFRVDAPGFTDIALFSMQQVGFHIRLSSTDARAKAQWRFAPSEREHGVSTPALPFIMGDFGTARWLVITEGQWDCITFAHAAGWLEHDAAWPDRVCCLGIRGVGGVESFLKAYRSHWPDESRCLLLPDADTAGARWFDQSAQSFARKLGQLCEEVHVKTVHGAKDFNHAWKAGLISQIIMNALFASVGFSN